MFTGDGLFIVPGRTSDGPVDVRSEGIRLSVPLDEPKLVGDRTGDGRDDVATTILPPGSGDTEIYSGAALVAPGPGGTFAGPPAETIAGELLGRISFDGGAPVLVTSANSRAGGREVTITLHGDPVVELTTAGSGVGLAPSIPGYVTDVHGVLDQGRVWVVLFQISRSGSVTWGWQLDDLCGPHKPTVPAVTTAPLATTVPPDAPPAVPVHGSAAFTG